MMSLMQPIFQFFGGDLGTAFLGPRPVDGGHRRATHRNWVGRIRSRTRRFTENGLTDGRGGLSRSEIRRAIAELNQYSDRELADLNLSRSEIPFAVRFGRPDHPHDLNRAA